MTRTIQGVLGRATENPHLVLTEFSRVSSLRLPLETDPLPLRRLYRETSAGSAAERRRRCRLAEFPTRRAEAKTKSYKMKSPKRKLLPLPRACGSGTRGRRRLLIIIYMYISITIYVCMYTYIYIYIHIDMSK